MAKKKRLRRYTKKPCPVCGSTDYQRELWGMCINYCRQCGKMYDVPPARYAKSNGGKISKSRKKKSPLVDSTLK